MKETDEQFISRRAVIGLIGRNDHESEKTNRPYDPSGVMQEAATTLPGWQFLSRRILLRRIM